MKSLLVLLYLIGGKPVMEHYYFDKVQDCHIAGSAKVLILQEHDAIILFAQCGQVQVTQVKKNKEEKL